MQRLAISALLVSAAAAAVAQTVPDAGSLLPKAPLIPTPPRLEPEPEAAPVRRPEATGPSVVVRHFVLVGRSLVPEDLITPALAPYLNRPLTFDDLESAAAAVAEVYRRAGWVVRTLLPKQQISDGQVTIEIVEARFGGAVVAPDADLRTSPARAVAMVEAAMPPGQAIQVDAMERVLLLLNDVPGLQAAGHLVAGRGPGQSDMSLRLSNAPRLTGQLDIDNTGSRSTGALRATAQGQLHGVLGQGERAALQLARSKGSEFIEAGVTVPAGPWGTRVGLKVSHLSYELVAPEFVPLRSHGTSDNVGLELSHPLLRQRLYGVSLAGNLDIRSFDNLSLGQTISQYGTEVLTLGVSGYAFDGYLGGGTSTIQAQVASGRVDLSGSPNEAQDAASNRTNGRFLKLRLALSRQQTLTRDLLASGQVANKNLDSSERFYLGGTYGVRAYPTSEGGGTEGVMANVELRQRLSDTVSVAGFYDWGEVHVLRTVPTASSKDRNNFALQGGGLTLTWQPDPRAQARITWAQRVGENPNPTAKGLDQDGTLVRNRLWAGVRIAF